MNRTLSAILLAAAFATLALLAGCNPAEAASADAGATPAASSNADTSWPAPQEPLDRTPIGPAETAGADVRDMTTP